MIKAILADALGMHLDSFQRIMVDPASHLDRALHLHPAVRGHHQLHHARSGQLFRRRPNGLGRAASLLRRPGGRRSRRGRIARLRSEPVPTSALGWAAWRSSFTAMTPRTGSLPEPSASPGERTFFLQAREGNRITSVACEKQQVSVLAEHLDRVLDEVLRRSDRRSRVPPASGGPSDTQPLDAPITEEFRVGTMTSPGTRASTGS